MQSTAEAEPAPPDAKGRRDQQGLDRTLVRGMAWTGAGKWSTQAISWLSWLLVARFLSPEDYGLVAMAAVFINLLKMLSEFGLGSAVVMLKDMAREQIEQIHGLVLLLGLGSFSVGCLLAWPLARFYDAPQLPLVVVALSAATVITAMRVVPQALLQRDLRFPRLAAVEAFQTLIVAPAVVLLAWAGFGHWTLVTGTLLSALAPTALCLIWQPVRPRWPQRSGLTQAVQLSGHVVIGRLAWYVYSNADFFIAGRVLGKAALGLYGLGWTLASMPLEKVAALIARVGPPILSAVQDDRAAMRRYFLIITEGLALVTFPTTIGLAIVADDVLPVVFGEQWTGAIGLLRILAISSVFRSLNPLLSQVLYLTGHSRFTVTCNLVAAVLLPAAFWTGATLGGTEGVAAAWVLVFPLVQLPLYARVFSSIELRPYHYLRALMPAIAGSALMCAAVLAVKFTVPHAGDTVLGLALQIGAGGLAYVAYLGTAQRRRLNSLRDLVRGRAGPRVAVA